MLSLISSNKVKARHFHCTKHFFDNFYAIDDGGRFGKSFWEIYPKELELKVENQGNHACFVNLDILSVTTSLYINCLIKEIQSLLQYFECLILTVTFHKIYFIQQLREVF